MTTEEIDHEADPLDDVQADVGAQATCPHCGETVAVALDPGGGTRQEYIEDCQVCCQPITLIVIVAARLDGSGHNVTVGARSGDD